MKTLNLDVLTQEELLVIKGGVGVVEVVDALEIDWERVKEVLITRAEECVK